jgi:hypothetical protein
MTSQRREGIDLGFWGLSILKLPVGFMSACVGITGERIHSFLFGSLVIKNHC